MHSLSVTLSPVSVALPMREEGLVLDVMMAVEERRMEEVEEEKEEVAEEEVCRSDLLSMPSISDSRPMTSSDSCSSISSDRTL